MAQNKNRTNYVKIRVKESNSIELKFFDASGELVDELVTVNQYLTSTENEQIERWIYDGVSPANYEFAIADVSINNKAYAKPYNR
jgi:hypothetical protein